MWNENAPLELLKELPAVLNEANLARLQSVIDYDKFINSAESGYDLCGCYAPFCRGCDKSVVHPCAVSYVRMKQAEGMAVRMEDYPAAEQVAVAEPEAECAATSQAEEPVEEKPKKIRIAVARKKIQP